MITCFYKFNGLARLLAGGTFAIVVICADYAVSGENNADDAMKQRARAEADANRAEYRKVTAANLYLGRAPWICTPSGFGQTSSCFRRASLHMQTR
jgi:hypothetical protein